MTDRANLLITASELSELLRREEHLPPDAPRTRVLDVRWTLPDPNGRPHFDAGHIPGAVYVDLDTELARHGDRRDGRHPLPDSAAFQNSARRWGIREQDAVVAYDGGGNFASARVWWLLRYHGFDRVRLLDGALPAWVAAGYELETGGVAVEPGDVELHPGALPVLELDEVAPFIAEGGTLLDSRAPERYRGEEEPIDPRAGHIPGAVNAPTGENLDDRGFFLTESSLQSRFQAAGVREGAPAGSYCGSGITATHNLFALQLAGVTGALYAGSWSQWSNHEELPVATGDEPGGA